MEEEYKTAYENLEVAIKELVALSGTGSVLTEWVLVTAARGWNDEGESYTEYSHLNAQGMAVHHIGGLLEYAKDCDCHE